MGHVDQKQVDLPRGGQAVLALSAWCGRSLTRCPLRRRRIPGDAISAEEDSLVENVHRVALHPVDQFRTLQTQRKYEEENAAILFVSVGVVKQRL